MEIRKIIERTNPKERSLITVEPFGDKILVVVEPTKRKYKPYTQKK